MKRLVGTYVLILDVARDCEIRVGALGPITFRAGHYAYVGSAMGGLRARLARHLRENKRMHWHIDYVLARARIREIWYRASEERRECAWAAAMGAYPDAEPHDAAIGASDCGCHTHLFWSALPFDANVFRAHVSDGDAIQVLSATGQASPIEILDGLAASPDD